MTILDIIALCLRSGDRVHITINCKDAEGAYIETDAYFAGFRHYGGSHGTALVTDFQGLYPVFREVARDGSMSRRLLWGDRSWDPGLIHDIVKTAPRALTTVSPEYALAYMKFRKEIHNESDRMLVELMKRYAAMHPGRPKVYLGEDDGVFGKIFNKEGNDLKGFITAVSYRDGRLLYDFQTSDCPGVTEEGSVHVHNRTVLLAAVAAAIQMPAWPDEKDPAFFGFIAPGARVRYNEQSAYREYAGTPGPVVTVKETQHTPVFRYDERVVILHDGKETAVTACELEPLAPWEKEKDNTKSQAR